MSTSMNIAAGGSYGVFYGSVLALALVVMFNPPVVVPSVLAIGSGLVGALLGYKWNRI